MRLETLKDFDWFNEPQFVRFDDDGMHVMAKYRTDFWCCARYDFRKDDGHFFYSNALGDFCCDLDWSFPEPGIFDQCGLMLRQDVNNWFKVSVMYEDVKTPMIATSLTVDGYSDLATMALPSEAHRVWYRLKKRKGCYIASYSIDGENFVQLRKFYLPHETDEIKIGAYICSPQQEDFAAILHGIDIK